MPTYMQLGDILGKGLPETEFVNYRAGSYVEPVDGATAFGDVCEPYFQRAPEHFSSHAQTPYDRPTGHPIAAINADKTVAYIYAAVFRGYREDGFYLYRELVKRMLELLLPDPLVKPLRNVAPSTEISLSQQQQSGRTIAHLVTFQPQRRTANNEFIEEAIAVHHVAFAVRLAQEPKRVLLVPGGEELSFTYEAGYCSITIPQVETSQLVVFE